MERLIEWKLINGGWPGPWVVFEDRVGRFIEANKLKPLAKESLQIRTLEAEGKEPEASSQINPIFRWDIRGGMRSPHLHYRGRIYLLDSKQWTKFSGELLKDFSKKLAEAGSVSYENVVELSNTMGAIV
ncbi:MAG TPA: hypothetical protein HA257_00410 [Candidatus Methanoperedenaceae archaeon]|nr:hypothetical protein [Candidatus Methanoperedenaceae archaeon]